MSCFQQKYHKAYEERDKYSPFKGKKNQWRLSLEGPDGGPTKQGFQNNCFKDALRTKRRHEESQENNMEILIKRQKSKEKLKGNTGVENNSVDSKAHLSRQKKESMNLKTGNGNYPV